MPNFLIIGAPKTGTTTLHYALMQHPDIFLCPLKEVGFFWAYEEDVLLLGPGAIRMKNVLVRNLEDYQLLFEKATTEKAIGEFSVRYIYHPRAPERIHRLIPNARLIASLRQPADRAFSAFYMNIRDGLEPCHDFREALEQDRQGIRDQWITCRYLNRGFYYASLKRYLDFFDHQQLHISLMEDLISDPQHLIQSIYSFLGVENNLAVNMSKPSNASGIIRRPIQRFIWVNTNRLRALVRPLFNARLRHVVTEWFIRDLEKPIFPPELRRELTNYYREDIERLQDLIERDLSHWLSN